MAIKQWLGVAPAIKQITTLTVSGSVAEGDTFTVKIGNGSITAIAGATPTVTTVAAAIVAAMTSNSVTGEFREIAWTSAAGVVTGTSNVAGVPFTVTVSKTGSSTFAASTTQTATGPNWANNVLNWSGGSLPTTGDDVVIGKSSASILYGMGSLTGLASIEIQLGFEQQIGLPEFNSLGYREYRQTHLAWGADKVTIGTGIGRGSSAIKLDMGTSGGDLIVLGTGTAFSDSENALQIIGEIGDCTIESGNVTIAGRPLETATIDTVMAASQAQLTIGSGCTLTTVTTLAGSCNINSDCTTLNVAGGNCLFTAQATTIDITGGILAYESDKSITTAKVGPGIFDCSDLRERNCTTLRLRSGGQVVDPRKTLQLNAIVFEAGVKGVTVS